MWEKRWIDHTDGIFDVYNAKKIKKLKFIN